MAATISTLSDLIEFSVKHKTLQGENTIGHMAVAIAGISLLINLMNLSFSEAAPGLVSALRTGINFMRRKPQWNSILVLDGMGSTFSVVLFSLKCIVESLVSCGNKVDSVTACDRANRELSPLSCAISKTMVTYVPFSGRPSSMVYLMESLCAA